MKQTTLLKIRRQLLDLKLPFKIKAAVLFGSMAKDRATEDSDVDLLIVAEPINSKLHRRGKEITLIKESLPPVPLDILLYTEQEVVSNFKNHNPLFLDIAVEGIVLFDKTGRLHKILKRRELKKLNTDGFFLSNRGSLHYYQMIKGSKNI